MALRSDGTIGDAAFQRIEEELDWAELDWAQFLRTADREG
jgi:CPA1 family monovalent cation:H+ antiporter